jgi:hypothetical protein
MSYLSFMIMMSKIAEKKFTIVPPFAWNFGNAPFSGGKGVFRNARRRELAWKRLKNIPLPEKQVKICFRKTAPYGKKALRKNDFLKGRARKRRGEARPLGARQTALF